MEAYIKDLKLKILELEIGIKGLKNKKKELERVIIKIRGQQTVFYIIVNKLNQGFFIIFEIVTT